MTDDKKTISVRFNEEEMKMMEEICGALFMTRCSVLKKAFHMMYEAGTKAGGFSSKKRKGSSDAGA